MLQERENSEVEKVSSKTDAACLPPYVLDAPISYPALEQSIVVHHGVFRIRVADAPTRMKFEDVMKLDVPPFLRSITSTDLKQNYCILR